jgi:hypothetical protein
MKAKVNIVTGLAAVLLTGCTASLCAQTGGTDNKDPNVHITVHKQTDANGNVISYDSSYTYIYSGKGPCSNAAIDSMMKKYGMSMNPYMLSMPLNTPDFSQYPNMQQFGGMDADKLQQMMQNQMNQMMQMYGMPPCKGFFCQPPPAQQCCPKDSVQYRHQNNSDKKNCPKQNKPKGGVQI